MRGKATAPAAGTIINALATGHGSAFAIQESITATVELDAEQDSVSGTITEDPSADTALIERCVSMVTDRYGGGEGGTVQTESEIPLAAGLKSSSAAANATILATLSALGKADEVDRTTACKIGVAAARDVGVTITGAFDDASASMLGGVTVTDNSSDSLLRQDPFEYDALVWTPPERAYSADADVDRCKQIAPIVKTATRLAKNGQYTEAMNINGLAYSTALQFPTEPALEALPHVAGVSLSGTGPSVVAIGNQESLKEVKHMWDIRDGKTWLTTTQNSGAQTI